MTNFLRMLLVAVVLAGTAGVCQADNPMSPLHNPINGLDVDANSRVNAQDALAVISVLLQPHGSGQSATTLAESALPLYYVDTNNDFRVSPRDALMVISFLTTATVPEPSSFILGSSALAGLAILAWRRRRARA